MSLLADYVFVRGRRPSRAGGFPHSEIRGSRPADGSPRLIAVFHVLRRLVMPRHPSRARLRLAREPLASRHVAFLHISRLVHCQRSSQRRIGGVVGLTGVEPVTSSLSGTRSNQLSYKPVAFAGGGSRIRTGDILLAKQALYQLSHAPTSSGRPPQGRRGGGTLERSMRGLQHRPPEGPSPQKGGDPTAGSPTVTLLRLHPNHHPHLRPTNAGLRVQTAFMM